MVLIYSKLVTSVLVRLNLDDMVSINHYLGKSKQDKKTMTIVDFFAEEKTKLPRLYSIVKTLAIVPCSSMPIESLFSRVSNKLTRKTNRLADSTLLNQLIAVFFGEFKTSVDQIL